MSQQSIYLPCHSLDKQERMVPMTDIWIIQQYDNKREILSIQTADGLYLSQMRSSLESALKFFNQFGFADVNGGTLANIPALIAYDPSLELAYFSKVDSVAVSRRNKSKVSHLPKLRSLP